MNEYTIAFNEWMNKKGGQKGFDPGAALRCCI